MGLTTSCNGNGCGRACGQKRGDGEGPSRVSNSRQNYDYPGDAGALSPTDPKRQFVEEPLDPDLWDTKKDKLVKAEPAQASNGDGQKGGYETPRKDGKSDKTASAGEDRDFSREESQRSQASPSPSRSPGAGASAGSASPGGQPNNPGHDDKGHLLTSSAHADSSPRPPPEEPGSHPRSRGREAEERARKRWKGAVRKVLMAKNMGAKIAMTNKIGSKLEGWFRDVALELQKGIAAEGRSQEQQRFEAPEGALFNRCRTACGYTQVRYFSTMGLQDGLTEPNLALIGGQDAAGKSGSFFFLSPDQQLIAKSCTNEDWRQLLRILPSYTDFVEAARERSNNKKDDQHTISTVVNNTARSSALKGVSVDGTGCVRGFTETLLPRFLGLYKLTLPGDDPKAEPVRVLVMGNVFGGALAIERRFDLKGSTHGRKASKKECAKRAPIFKDIDWVASEPGLMLGSSDRSSLIKAVEQDLAFLAKHGLMDYSLLVGVHDLPRDVPSVYEPMNVVTVRDVTRHCYIGIIDVLTPYKIKKRAETFCMGSIVCGRDISCQHPKVYAQRFYQFVDQQVFDLAKGQDKGEEA